MDGPCRTSDMLCLTSSGWTETEFSIDLWICRGQFWSFADISIRYGFPNMEDVIFSLWFQPDCPESSSVSWLLAHLTTLRLEPTFSEKGIIRSRNHELYPWHSSTSVLEIRLSIAPSHHYHLMSGWSTMFNRRPPVGETPFFWFWNSSLPIANLSLFQTSGLKMFVWQVIIQTPRQLMSSRFGLFSTWRKTHGPVGLRTGEHCHWCCYTFPAVQSTLHLYSTRKFKPWILDIKMSAKITHFETHGTLLLHYSTEMVHNEWATISVLTSPCNR
jgi:hypothetical protein